MKYLDYYEVLKLSRSAGRDEIKNSFRSLAKIYHPDICGNTVLSLVRFRNILEAYNTLSDNDSRQIYDTIPLVRKTSGRTICPIRELKIIFFR